MATLRWLTGTRPTDCRACGFAGDAPLVVEFPLPRSAVPGLASRCPDCGTLDLIPEILPSDEVEEATEAYLEVGAGIGTIADLVDSLGPADGRRLLDVGCGFGFGPDYARFGGWDAVGVEPSNAGRLGRELLGLDIRTGYFGPGWSEERFDAVISSEVLEHVPDPGAFLRGIAEHLRPGGQIVLTTPDPEVVDPRATPGDVAAVLSAGFHFALYSRVAVEQMLRDAGFARVELDRAGLSHRIRARIDDVPLVDAPPTAASHRVEYLADRAAQTSGALSVGLWARAYRLVVAHGDFRRARRMFPDVRAAFRARHGVDPGKLRSIARRQATEGVPGALGGVLFAAGMTELLDGDPQRAVDLFEHAEASMETWRRAWGSADLDSADVVAQSRFHRLLALVQVDPRRAADEASRLIDPSRPADSVESAQLARVYVDLAGRGHGQVATTLEPAVASHAAALATSVDPTRAHAGRMALEVLAARRALAPSDPAGPSPGLSWMLDTYWSDPHGAFFSGWIHAEGEPGESLEITRGGVTAVARRTERPDLEAFWPEAAGVSRSGFELYLPGPAGPEIALRLHLTHETRELTAALPLHPLPVDPIDPSEGRVEDRIRDAVRTAPTGPVLSLGARRSDPEVPAEVARRAAGRRIVGFDIHPGHGVDLIGDVHRLTDVVGRGAYPVVFSGSLLEHVTAPWLVAVEIARALPLGGVSVHIAPWVWPTHSEPNDFWRFSDAGLRRLFGPELGFEVVDGGACDPVRAYPSATWRESNLAFPTHPVPATSWIVVRKVDDRADSIDWPYDAAQGREWAETYPIEAISATRRGARG